MRTSSSRLVPGPAPAVFLAIVFTALAAIPVRAAPHDLPPTDYLIEDVLPAGQFCDFAVELQGSGREGFIELDAFTLDIFPASKVTLTNVEFSRSVSFALTGPRKVVEDFDAATGGTVTIHQYGPWLHIHPGQLYLARGHVIRTISLGPGPSFLGVEEDLSHARTTDLCAELTP